MSYYEGASFTSDNTANTIRDFSGLAAAGAISASGVNDWIEREFLMRGTRLETQGSTRMPKAQWSTSAICPVCDREGILSFWVPHLKDGKSYQLSHLRVGYYTLAELRVHGYDQKTGNITELLRAVCPKKGQTEDAESLGAYFK